MDNKSSSFLLSLKGESNIDRAFDRLGNIIRDKGLNYYFFTSMNTQDAPTIFKVNHFRTTYPEEWLKAYFDNRYFYDDPIARRVMMNETPFFWSEHLSTIQGNISPETEKMFSHAAEYSICDGIGFSYLKDKNRLYTFTVSSAKPFDIYDIGLLAEFYLIGAYLVDLYEEQSRTADKFQPLSIKEKEIISLGAIGKTDAEIALLKDISVNTVRYHWKNIFRKMDSYSRVFSIIRAINLGHIDTDIFEVTTDSGSIETYSRKL